MPYAIRLHIDVDGSVSLSFATYNRWETEPKLSSLQNNRSKQVFMAYSIGIFDQKKLKQACSATETS